MKKHKIYEFRSIESARGFASKAVKAHWILEKDGKFFVTKPATFEQLLKEGYKATK